MENRRASLSSASSSLDDLLARVTESAEELRVGGEEALAYDLYEVERSLRVAQRRLGAVVRRMR
ncbi:MAG TPA: hypothetical protein VIY72_14900 [Acidimicrobiales bacterium]